MESHLLQMRGLKPICIVKVVVPSESHLLQMRGLKQTEEKRPPNPVRGRIFYRCVD